MSRMFLVLILLALELYTFFALRTLIKNKYILMVFWVVVIIVYAFIFYQFNLAQRESRFDNTTAYTIALLLTFAVPKLVIIVLLFLEDIVRFFSTIYNYFQHDQGLKAAIPSRRKFISQMALGLAAIPFAGFIYGVFKGKYDFRVINQHIEFDDLPDAFDGFTITHISDIHSGSFDNRNKIKYGVNLINDQNSDVILFTGDMVNAKADEMDPWMDIFKTLNAKYGMYSILGNHDYGFYAYNNKDDIKANQKKLNQVHKDIGFELLNNESRTITKNGEKINILGVENWGASPFFPKRGSLNKATQHIKEDDFNILMSHDPSHFDYKELKLSKRDKENPDVITNETNIVNYSKTIHLTLSGHTHGMQFGIEIPFLGLKWSPVKYRYPKWAGLYKEAGRFLYVNRGFGFLAFPGRVGIWPEITVITLKKTSKTA